MQYTARQAAEEIADGLAVHGRRPSIYADKVKTLVKANRLRNVSSHSRVMIERSEVEDFIRDTRYVTALDVLGLHDSIYRVSVLARHEDVVHDDHGALLRAVAGVDFSDAPTSRDELGGWEGVWPITESKADSLTDQHGLLLASCRGYVGPGHIRRVIGHSRCQTRRYLHTAPASGDVQDFLATGVWLDIPDGPICDFVKAEK